MDEVLLPEGVHGFAVGAADTELESGVLLTASPRFPGNPEDARAAAGVLPGTPAAG